MASPQASSQKTAAVIARPNLPGVAQILPGLFQWLGEHGYKVIIDVETAAYTSGQQVVPRQEMASHALDLVVVLGGDGTLLSAARATAAVAPFSQSRRLTLLMTHSVGQARTETPRN